MTQRFTEGFDAYGSADDELMTAWTQADWRTVDAWRLADTMARNAAKRLSRRASLLARSSLSD